MLHPWPCSVTTDERAGSVGRAGQHAHDSRGGNVARPCSRRPGRSQRLATPRPALTGSPPQASRRTWATRRTRASKDTGRASRARGWRCSCGQPGDPPFRPGAAVVAQAQLHAARHQRTTQPPAELREAQRPGGSGPAPHGPRTDRGRGRTVGGRNRPERRTGFLRLHSGLGRAAGERSRTRLVPWWPLGGHSPATFSSGQGVRPLT